MSGILNLLTTNTVPVATGGGDPYWNNVELLIAGGGTNGGTSIVDKSKNALSITNYNITFDNTQTKFASTSLKFVSTSFNSGLRVADSAALEMPGDFTWEAWVRPTTTSGFYGIIGFLLFGRVLICNNSGFYWETGNGSSVGPDSGYPPPVSLTANAWQHLAYTRSGNVWRAFKDGTQAGSDLTETFTPETTNAYLEIGHFNGINANKFNGWMEDIRFTKGVARYTSSFTAPTASFPQS